MYGRVRERNTRPEMYVRVKRERLTVFVQADASDTVNSLKTSLKGLVDDEKEFGLMKQGVLLDGLKTVVDSAIENDDVLELVFKIGEGWWHCRSVSTSSTSMVLDTYIQLNVSCHLD